MEIARFALEHRVEQPIDLGGRGLTLSDAALEALVAAADGDARRALGMLETVADLAVDGVIDAAQIADLAAGTRRRFDKGGEQFYDQISALHKAVRGSDPDAALYWLARMLDGGCDPAYLARRPPRLVWRFGTLSAVWCAAPRSS